MPAHSHKHLALIDKLQLILHDKVARLEFVQVLNRAFFVLLKGSSRKGIAYGELCDQLMLALSSELYWGFLLKSNIQSLKISR